MSKLDQSGKPIIREDGKILKSDRYFKPDLQKVIKYIKLQKSSKDQDKYGYNKHRLDKTTLPNKPITLDNIEELGFYIEHMEGYTYFHPIAEYIYGPTHTDLSNWCKKHMVITFHDFADYIDRRIEYLTKVRDERGF